MPHQTIRTYPLLACVIVCFVFISACSSDPVRSSADAVAIPALAPMLLFPMLLWHDAEYGHTEALREAREHEKLLDDENNIYSGMSQQLILNKLGDPVAVYACQSNDSSVHYKVWEYLDERFPYNYKYLIFGTKNSKVTIVDDRMPYEIIAHYTAEVCCAFQDNLGNIGQITFDNICNTELKLSEVQSELSSMKYATDALLRGDMEAAYRLLEDVLIVDNAGVANRARKLIMQNPHILRGARSSFSKRSLKESLSDYGTDAISLESKRLSIYKAIAPAEDYEYAQQNYEEILGSTR